MDLEALRLMVYRVFATTGYAPTFAQLQEQFMDSDEIRTGLTSEMLRSNTFAPGFFAGVGAWLDAHDL